VSYGEVLEDRYIRVTVLYVVVLLLCYFYYYVMCSLLGYVFFVSLSILIVMYVPFCVIVLFCVLFV
jgi:hypothetical protein